MVEAEALELDPEEADTLNAQEANVLKLDPEEAWRSRSRQAYALDTSVLDAATCDAPTRGGHGGGDRVQSHEARAGPRGSDGVQRREEGEGKWSRVRVRKGHHRTRKMKLGS